MYRSNSIGIPHTDSDLVASQTSLLM